MRFAQRRRVHPAFHRCCCGRPWTSDNRAATDAEKADKRKNIGAIRRPAQLAFSFRFPYSPSSISDTAQRARQRCSRAITLHRFPNLDRIELASDDLWLERLNAALVTWHACSNVLRSDKTNRQQHQQPGQSEQNPETSNRVRPAGNLA